MALLEEKMGNIKRLCSSFARQRPLSRSWEAPMPSLLERSGKDWSRINDDGDKICLKSNAAMRNAPPQAGSSPGTSAPTFMAEGKLAQEGDDDAVSFVVQCKHCGTKNKIYVTKLKTEDATRKMH